MINGFIHSRQIDFAALRKYQFRHATLLRWVGRAVPPVIVSENRRWAGFRLLGPPQGARCSLRSEDGDLEMPAYRIHFEEEQHG